MNAKNILAELTQKEEFRAWKKGHEQDVLAHIFFEKGNNQVGYYDAAKGTMTTFVLGDELQIIPEQEILRGDGEIDQLDVDDVTIDIDQAKTTATATMHEHYGKQQLLKTLVILQSIEGKTLYNITFFTQSLKTINIKIDATNGDVITHTQASLVSKM